MKIILLTIENFTHNKEFMFYLLDYLFLALGALAICLFLYYSLTKYKRNWRNNLDHNDHIKVKCSYKKGKQTKYVYIMAIIDEMIDDNHYSVIYDDYDVNMYIEKYIDKGLEVSEKPNKKDIYSIIE